MERRRRKVDVARGSFKYFELNITKEGELEYYFNHPNEVATLS